MVSFVQQTEGVRPTDIGNQRIVQEDLSYINSIGKAVDTAIQGADIVGTAIGKQKAKDIVAEAQQTVDTEVKEAEELAKIQSLGDEAGPAEIARKTALLEKGVARGRISRENARLRVADLVSKGIEENPIFASKIRQSASNLLGFNPESEAVRQFFGAFQPASTATQMSADEKNAQFLSSNSGLSLTASRQLIAQGKEVALRKQIRQDQLELGDMTVDQYLAAESVDDDIEGTNAIFGDALALARQNKPINADTWSQLAAQRENAFVMQVLTAARSSGVNITSEQEAKVRENAKARYDRLVEQLGRFDETFLNKQNLERMVTAQKLFGAQAMPVFSTLVNSFGDRIGSQILDLYANAAGKPERLQAMLGANPALAPFVTMLQQDPAKFSERMNNSLLKLNNPDAEMTPEDTGFIDLFLNQTLRQANPEDRKSVIDMLVNKGMPTKAASVLANAGRTGAAPEEVNFMKGEWDLVQGVSPNAIIDKIKQGNRSLSDRGATVQLSQDGKHLLLMQGRDLSTGLPRQATGHPAYADIQKINTFLNAAEKGWGKDLGITDTSRLAQQFVNSINQGVTAPTVSNERREELRQEALRRLGRQ